MKKLIAFMLCVTMSIFLLVGCSSAPQKEEKSDGKEEKPESLTILTSTDFKAFLEEIGKEFEEKEGIKINVISEAYDNTHDKITTSVTGGAEVDMAYLDTIWPAEFAASGIALPIDEYLSDEERGKIIDTCIDQLVYDGKTYGIPFVNNGKWMFYNKAILKEGGYDAPPATWDELFEMSKSLVDQGLVKYGISYGSMQAEGIVCDMTTWLYAYGGQWMDDSGNFVFNSDEGVKALEAVVNSTKDGTADPASITYNDRTCLDTFLAGDTAFAMSWSFAWDLINSDADSHVKGDVGICLIPGTEEGATVSSSVSGGGGMCMLSTTKYPEWTWKFMENLLDPEVQIKAMTNGGTLPTLKSVYEDEELLSQYPYLKDFYPQYEYMHYRPVLAQYSEWSNLMQQALSAAMSGEKSPKEALDDAAEASARLK